MKCHPTYVSVSPQALLIWPIIFSPHAPIFSRSHELVSQYTTEQQDVIPDLPQFWMVIYSPHAQDFSWSNNQSSDITGHSPIRPPTMNLFHNIRQKNKLSSQTYPNSEWLYAPLTPKDFSWSNKWLDVTRHSPVRPPTYPVTYLDPQVYHISNNNTALTRNRVPGFCPPGMQTGLVAVEFSRADHQATDTLKLQLFS